MLGPEVTMVASIRLLCRESHRLLEVREHRDHLPPALAEVAVLLMDRLPANTELLRDRLPRPAAPSRPLDVKRLQHLKQPPERRDGSQTIRRIPTGCVPGQCDHLLLLRDAHLVKAS